MRYKNTWECPTCLTCFYPVHIPELIERFERWLSFRGKVSLICDSDKIRDVTRFVSELKSIQVKYIRPESKMMESQIIKDEEDGR